MQMEMIKVSQTSQAIKVLMSRILCVHMSLPALPGISTLLGFQVPRVERGLWFRLQTTFNKGQCGGGCS